MRLIFQKTNNFPVHNSLTVAKDKEKEFTEQRFYPLKTILLKTFCGLPKLYDFQKNTINKIIRERKR